MCIPPHAFHSAKLLNPSRYDRITTNIQKTVLSPLNSSWTDLSSCFFRVPSTMLKLMHLGNAEVVHFTGLVRDPQSALSS